MPSIRKRAPKQLEPQAVADGGQVIPQPVVKAALDDALESVAAEREAASAQSLAEQVEALRRAEAYADQRQAEIAAMMGPRDTAPAEPPPDDAPAAQAPAFTEAEDRLNAAFPQLLSDPLHAQVANAVIASLHQRGITRGSEQYELELRPTFEAILSTAHQQAAPPPPPPPPVMATTATPPAPAPREPMPAPPRIPVAAPVSRDIPSYSGGRMIQSKVTLTMQEREHARLSMPGVDPMEAEAIYAKHKLRLQTLKQQGHYAERDG